MSLLVVDDHPLFIAGLSAALRQCATNVDGTPAVQVNSAPTLQQGLELARSLAPDMVLLDFHLQEAGGLQVLHEFAQKLPWIARVVISGDTREHVQALARANAASGFIAKTLPIETVWLALQTIAAGGEWWMGQANPNLPHESGANPTFTLRQLEVLALIDQGLSNKAIAESLKITERTVKQHTSDLLARCGAANRVQLLNISRTKGWLR